MTLSRIRTITAAHEAAHAVMRKIRGLPATRLTIDDLGNGYCAGTGKRIDAESMLLITLAGPVWELSFVGLDPKLLDLKSTRSDDISEALALLNRCEHLRVRVASKHPAAGSFR